MKYRTECPWLSVSDELNEIKEFYDHYQAGHLLLAGGIADQPVSYLRAISKMRIAMNKARSERRDQVEAEMKSKSKAR